MKTKKRKKMKLKKAKNIETSLVAVLEFVRVIAQLHPNAVNDSLAQMKINSDTFAPCVNQLVKLAVKNADEIGACIYDVLATLRHEAAKRQKKNKNPNPYSNYNESIKKNYDSTKDKYEVEVQEDDDEESDDE